MNYKYLTSDKLLNKLDKQSSEEKLSEIPEGLIQLVDNDIINYCFNKKTGLKEKPTPRVLVNWVKNGIVKVDEKDKGKIKRFDKLESIWLNILVEMRDFGLPIKSIQRARKILFEYAFKNLTLFKFQILNTIIKEQQILVVYKDGASRIIDIDGYTKLLNKHFLQPHLSFKLTDFIELEYPNNSFNQNFNITAPFENIGKMKLLFFLRTGEFQFMKVKLSEGDTRYIENVEMLLKSEDVLKAFLDWKFEEIIISIDDEANTVITSKN